jgi:hypothetical protein
MWVSMDLWSGKMYFWEEWVSGCRGVGLVVVMRRLLICLGVVSDLGHE